MVYHTDDVKTGEKPKEAPSAEEQRKQDGADEQKPSAARARLAMLKKIGAVQK